MRLQRSARILQTVLILIRYDPLNGRFTVVFEQRGWCTQLLLRALEEVLLNGVHVVEEGARLFGRGHLVLSLSESLVIALH